MIENGERRNDTSRVYAYTRTVVTILAVIAVIALVNPIFSQNKRVGAQLQVERMVEQDETNCASICQFMGTAEHDECMKYCSTAPRGADLCKLCINYCTQNSKPEGGFVATPTKCQYFCIESGICDSQTLKTRGNKTAAQSDIVGGTMTDASEFPYIVSIQQRGTLTHFCGGTLISARSVLTAAHCCEPVNANDIEVVLGETHLLIPNAGQQRSRVDEIIMHPNYDPSTYHNDVCVLTMRDNANVDDPEANIDFAVLARQDGPAPPPGTQVVVVGWGASRHKGPVTPTLRKATMQIMSDEQCKRKFQQQVAFFSSFMCAHSPGSTQDTCDGDSGGPILIRGVQIGIISFGFECGREPPALPSIYQEMTFFRSWIDEQKTGPRSSGGGGGCVSTDSLVNVMMKKNVGDSVLMKKRVGEVAIGDYVETTNGFEMVWLIMPYGVESEIEMEMVEMTVELGDGNVESIVLTREHLMFDGATGQMKRAHEFGMGDQVQIFVGGKRSAGVLVELSTVVKTGTSLVTNSGQFVLSNGICVSSYSHSPLYAQVVHALSLPFRWMSLMGQPTVGKLVLEMLRIPHVVRPGTAFSSMFA